MLRNSKMNENVKPHEQKGKVNAVNDCSFDDIATINETDLHVDGMILKCSLCNGIEFPSFEALEKHRILHKEYENKNQPSISLSQIKCEECGQEFPTSDGLKAHMYIHKHETFECLHCGKTFKSPRYLKKHEMLKHNTTSAQQRYKCKECPKTFKEMRFLETHIERGDHVPSRAKPRCSLCAREFKNETLLRLHMDVHNGIKPFTCEFCGKQFHQKCQLKRHMVVHEEDNLFECPICKRTCKHESTYREHMRMHQFANDIETHPEGLCHVCNVCEAPFRQRKNLLQHMRCVHSKQNNLYCEVCDKHFSRKNLLKNHYTSDQHIKKAIQYQMNPKRKPTQEKKTEELTGISSAMKSLNTQVLFDGKDGYLLIPCEADITKGTQNGGNDLNGLDGGSANDRRLYATPNKFPSSGKLNESELKTGTIFNLRSLASQYHPHSLHSSESTPIKANGENNCQLNKSSSNYNRPDVMSSTSEEIETFAARAKQDENKANSRETTKPNHIPAKSNVFTSTIARPQLLKPSAMPDVSKEVNLNGLPSNALSLIDNHGPSMDSVKRVETPTKHNSASTSFDNAKGRNISIINYSFTAATFSSPNRAIKDDISADTTNAAAQSSNSFITPIKTQLSESLSTSSLLQDLSPPFNDKLFASPTTPGSGNKMRSRPKLHVDLSDWSVLQALMKTPDGKDLSRFVLPATPSPVAEKRRKLIDDNK